MPTPLFGRKQKAGWYARLIVLPFILLTGCAKQDGNGPDEEQEHRHMIEKIQEMVGRKVPADATVLVISDKDDELLKLGEQRKGWHFPRAENGTDHGSNPADTAGAIAHLEALRKRGAQFLVIPAPAFWWVDDKEGYKGFRQYLETNYRAVAIDRNVCVIFDLRKG
jgi:hypothetical protein